jgi:hypothetical protein
MGLGADLHGLETRAAQMPRALTRFAAQIDLSPVGRGEGGRGRGLISYGRAVGWRESCGSSDGMSGIRPPLRLACPRGSAC